MENIEHRLRPAGSDFLPGFMRGAKLAVPIMLGYFPGGVAFGVLARDAGLSCFEASLMSLITFTGSSQFVAIAQIAAGAPLGIMLVTCGIVNMRYLLMSASLAAKFSKLPFFQKLLFGAELTDETFAVNAMRSEHATAEELAAPPRSFETIGLNVMSHFMWFFATLCGAYFGGMLEDVGKYGVDFGLVAIFVALIAPRMKDPKQLCVVIFAGLVALACYLLGLGTWSIVVATVAGATLGGLLP